MKPDHHIRIRTRVAIPIGLASPTRHHLIAIGSRVIAVLNRGTARLARFAANGYKNEDMRGEQAVEADAVEQERRLEQLAKEQARAIERDESRHDPVLNACPQSCDQ